jgi:hypothetical protein
MRQVFPVESADDGHNHSSFFMRLDFSLFASLAAAEGEPLFSHFPQIKHGFEAVRIRENP